MSQYRGAKKFFKPITQTRLFSQSSKVDRHYTTTFKASDLGKNLAKYDIFALSEKPENNVEMISKDSIIFSNLKVIKSPNKKNEPLGALLLNNQIFEINLKDTIIEHNGVVVEIDQKVLELFKIVYPKPDLLVMGLGIKTRMLGKETRNYLSNLGIRVELSDTRNCALNYDLLATERSPSLVGALMLPPNM